MGVEAVIATQVIDTTSVGRSIMTAVDAAAARTALSLGTLATQSGTFSGTHSGTSSGTNSGDQDLSGYLTSAAAASTYQVSLVSGTNLKTVNGSTLLGSGDLAISGLSGTGSVDNAVLRADGTGGATLQSSAWIINDNLTASPNNTVNHACLEVTGGTTNVSVSIKPKGAGAFCLAAPDGTSTGGNVRGANAADLQTSRATAAQVASGQASFVIGQRNTASGRGAFAGGYEAVASGTYEPFAFGERATASGSEGATAIGSNVASTANYTFSSGSFALSARHGMRSHAAGRFSASGDCQEVGFIARNVTTSAVATELFLDGSSTRLTIPSGKVLSALVRVTGVKSDGSEVIKFLRDVTIKNVGGTTATEVSPVTIGTDINVSGATLDLSADNTNDSLKIAVTPPTGTWRWAAVVEVALEIAYGT